MEFTPVTSTAASSSSSANHLAPFHAVVHGSHLLSSQMDLPPAPTQNLVKLDNPIVVDRDTLPPIGTEDVTFTHRLGNSFGDRQSIEKYQKIIKSIEKKWPELAKAMKEAASHDRTAIFTTSDPAVLKEVNRGGCWGPLTSNEPHLKEFSSAIVVDVNSGKASIVHTGHEWGHEIQSVNHDILKGKNPTKAPIALKAYKNHADETEVVRCWNKGFEEYRKAKPPANDPRHTIYGKPAIAAKNWCDAKDAGMQAVEQWNEFTHEIGAHMVSAGLEHGDKALLQHAPELCKLINEKLDLKVFPEKGFKNKVGRAVRRCGAYARAIGTPALKVARPLLKTLGPLLFALDVYHEYNHLGPEVLNKEAHALINGSTRHILGQALSMTSMSEATLYDTSHLGTTGQSAYNLLEESVGKEKLQKIALKGNRARGREQMDFPLNGNQMLVGEEREIYNAYMNTVSRNTQESIQDPITQLYDTVKQTMTDALLRRSADPKAFLEAVNTLTIAIEKQLEDKNIWDPQHQTQLADTLRTRAEEVFKDIPKIQPVLPPERIAEALPSSSSAASSRSAPASFECHVMFSVPDQEEPVTEHPFVNNLKSVQETTKKLIEEVESAERAGRPLDASTLERVDQLTYQYEAVSEQLQKQWDRKTEYYTMGMECVRLVAAQLQRKFQHDRLDQAEKSARKREQRDYEHHTNRFQQSARVPISYVDIENFSHDQFYPQGHLYQTLLEVRVNCREQVERLHELQSRRNMRIDALDSAQQLLSNTARTDQSVLDTLEHKLEQQQKIAKGLQFLSTWVGTAANILVAVGCPAALSATLSAAYAISEASQSAFGKKTDRIAEEIRDTQAKSLQAQEGVARNARIQQHEMDIIDAQIAQSQHFLLTQSSWCYAQGFRASLESGISIRKKEIDTLQNEINELNGFNKVFLQPVLKAAEDAFDNAQVALNKKPESKTCKEKLDATSQKLNRAQASALAHQTKLNTATNRRDDLLNQNKADQRSLEREQFLAPMKEQIESVILAEQSQLDFDRQTNTNEELGIQAGTLTQLGEAQQQMRISFSQYNYARMQKRQLWLSGFQAGDGLFRELSYFLQTQKPMFAVELMRQFHYLDDLQKHFSECGVPQFQRFLSSLELNDGISFLEKIGKINVSDLCTGFIFPGIQIITTCLAIVRLGQMLKSNQRFTPEQQFMLDLVEGAFQRHQEVMNAQFDALRNHLDRNQAELKDELKQLHSDISFISQELHKAIENGKKEIQGQLISQDFNAFKFEVDQLVRTWRERDRTFWNHFEFMPEAKRVHKALSYLGELEAALLTCGENSLNGLTLKDKRWQSRFTPEYMATAPEYVSGALAQQIGLNVSVPNLSLFKTLSDCVENLRRSCHYPEVQNQLDRLQPLLEKYQAPFITLSSLREDTLRSAMLARRDYLNSILEAKTKTRQFSLAVQKQLVQGQITHLLAENGNKWLDTERVGEHKFFLSKLVHQGPISSQYSPNISSLNNSIDIQHLHHFAKHLAVVGTVGGAGLGLMGGPVGSAIGAGIGGTGSYAYSLLLGGTFMAIDGAENWLNGTTSPSRQRELLLEREIKEILNRSIVENIKLRQSPKRDSDFTIQAEFCNNTQQHLVTALKIERSLGQDGLFSATHEHSRPKNSKPIVAFRITSGSELIDDDAQVFNFERNSLIQSQDIARIAPAPNSVDYAVRSRRMLRSYFDFLFSKLSEAGMEESNPFKAIAQKAQLIPSATGEFLPIAMPPELLQSIEERVYATDFGLMAMKEGGLVPSFHFQKTPSGGLYEFTVIYKRFNSSAEKPEEYGEIPLLTFDRAVVESFRKVSFPQQGNEHDYVFGQPNLQEFLIQAWYCGLFELGLPGKGTIRLTNADVFVPNEVSFAGVYTLLKQNPNRKIHYTSEFAGENHNKLLGHPLQFKQGRGAFRVWLDAKQGKPKPKSIEKAAQAYNEKYHLAKAHFNLFSQLDPRDVNEWFEQRLGLFSPK